MSIFPVKTCEYLSLRINVHSFIKNKIIAMCYNSSNSYEHTIFQPITPFSRRKKKITLPFFNRTEGKKKRNEEKERSLNLNFANECIECIRCIKSQPQRMHCKERGDEGSRVLSFGVSSFYRKCSRGIRGKWVLAKCYYKFYLFR